jgi:hypothetical protein
MRKNIYLLLGLAFLIAAIFLLNMEVTYRQGVDYKVGLVRIPLYLKITDFFDRSFNYQALVNRIVNRGDSESMRAVKILTWVDANIKPVPGGFPVIDDHVWNIIVRGYGTADQQSDVFATLCNYAGIEAFFSNLPAQGNPERLITLSFLKIDNEWRVFDPACGAYFRNRNGQLAFISELKNGDWDVFYIKPRVTVKNYQEYFSSLGDISGAKWKRSSIQSPLKRLLYQLFGRKDKGK